VTISTLTGSTTASLTATYGSSATTGNNVHSLSIGETTAFTRDDWQIRLETVLAVDIRALQQCATTPVRVTSDSAVKAVGVADNRRFVYAGSSDLLDLTPPSEALLSLIGAVLDQVP
jgi:hypothetical protein